MKLIKKNIVYALLLSCILFTLVIYQKEKTKVSNLQERLNSSAVQVNTSEENYTEGIEKKKIEINPIDIDLNRTDGYTLIDECNWDIDADSTIESINLYVDAEKSEDGEFMFDDEHRWLLLVRDDHQEYVLFDKGIHIGELEANIYKVYNEDSNDTHITTVLRTTAGFVIKEYIKDENRDIFTEEVIMERIGINYITNLGGGVFY